MKAHREIFSFVHLRNPIFDVIEEYIERGLISYISDNTEYKFPFMPVKTCIEREIYETEKRKTSI